MFPEDCIASRPGPVCLPLFDQHRGMFFLEASSPVTRADTGGMTEGERDAINRVVDRYGRLTGNEMHGIFLADSLWRKYREGLDPNEFMGPVIPKNAMLDQYSDGM